MDAPQHLTVVDPQDKQLTVGDLKSRVTLIQEVMKAVMIEDTHYGVIPGTSKKTLYKPGAEVLGVVFKLAPRFTIERENLENGHREYQCTTVLYHTESGQVVGEGVGSCSTLESKYRYRIAARLCPACGVDTIMRGRQDYGGWYCNRKKGGCGANFKDGDARIEQQEQGRIENPDPADLYNTVLKMAVKRSHVAACLIATAASDIFVQVAEGDEAEEEEVPAQATRDPAQPTQAASTRYVGGGDGPLYTAPMPEQPNAPHASFAPDVAYTGTITKLMPRETQGQDGHKRNIPGHVVLKTEQGPLQAFFWERPESLKAVEDWSVLIGQPGSLVFSVKEDRTGTRFRYVKEFQCLAPGQPEMDGSEVAA